MSEERAVAAAAVRKMAETIEAAILSGEPVVPTPGSKAFEDVVGAPKQADPPMEFTINGPDPPPLPAPKKRRSSRSPTERSLERLRREGWRAAVVERHVSFQGGARGRGFKRDLFGFIDVLAYRVHVPAGERRKPPGEDFGDIGLLAVQATSGPHVAARVEKILGAPQEDTDKGRAAASEVRAAALDWLLAGGRIEVHGWRKSARTKRYELRVVPVTLVDFEEGR